MSAPGDYEGAVAELQRRGRFGIRLGLARTRAVLRRLGNPEAGIRGVLIGGTNGKGSVQALVGAALREQGTLAGQMPKPHLAEYRERIVIDGQPIDPPAFASAVSEALKAAEAVERRHGPPTEFELLTSAAFLAFARAGVETAVVEVGMGGRLDATNAWQGGISAITNVGLDHTQYLGETIAQIAREKAAIIKHGDLHALTAAQAGARAVIQRRARRMGVPLTVVEPLPVVTMGRRGTSLRGPGEAPLRIGLLGRHQAANASLALAVVEALADAGFASRNDDATRRAFETARWPGRLELLVREPDGRISQEPGDAARPGTIDIVLDGAHNPDGAAALAAALDELAPQLSAGRAVLLLGMLRDKDIAAMLAALRRSGLLRDAQVIATTVPDAPRALPAQELARAWSADAKALADVTEALDTAVGAALAAGGPLVVCGSLYLVGKVRTALLHPGGF